MARRRTTRIGLIGCGGFMHAHLHRLGNVRGVRVTALCDPDSAAARRLAQACPHPVRIHADHRRMLRDDDLDAVIIATPHRHHFAQARAGLEHGLHVLVEKPLTIGSADAAGLIELAKAKRRILHVSYQRHHAAVYKHARDIIRGGKLGRVCSISGFITQNWSSAGGWRLDPKMAGGGMFMDTGSHLVAAALYLSDLHVSRVVAIRDDAGQPVDINMALIVDFDGGATGTLNFVGNAAAHDECLAIHGDRGSVMIRQRQFEVCDAQMNGAPLRAPGRVTESSPDRDFCRWVRGAGGYERPAFAVEVARLAEGAYRSAKSGRPVKVG